MRKIVVGDLYKRGAPRAWPREKTIVFGHGSSASFRLEPKRDLVRVFFTRAVPGLDDEEGFIAIALERTRLHHGERTWFLCPHCSGRVGAIYITAVAFACRTCCRLRYRSQIDPTEPDRSHVRTIRARLGPTLTPGGKPTRPKGMHQVTYERLCAELEELESRERERTGDLESFIDVFRDALAHALHDGVGKSTKPG